MMVDWRFATRLASAAMLVACGTTTPAGSSDAAVDAAPDVPAYTCTPQDAGLNVAYSSLDASPDCPAQWDDLTHDGGIPNACTVEGLVCVYPEGQAVCASAGAAGVLWWTVGAGVGCGEFPPTQCDPCSVTPGSICEYANAPSDPNRTVDFCCDGDDHRWRLLPDGGCPNGNVCGTIHASDYDQTCTTTADCARVTEGDLCTMVCTDCINAAISTHALAQYQADFANKLNIPRDCPCPLGPPVVCNAGACALAP